jgi:hypothetical protein
MFKQMKKDGKVDDTHCMLLLERNVNPNIIDKLYSTGQEFPTSFSDMCHWVANIGRGWEIHQERRRILKTWTGPAATTSKETYRDGNGKTYGGAGKPMEIDAVRRKPRWDKKGNPRCFNCDEFGHMSKDCKKPKRIQKAPGSVTCFNCGKQGHMSRNCRSPKRGKIRSQENGDTDSEAQTEDEEGFVEESA